MEVTEVQGAATIEEEEAVEEAAIDKPDDIGKRKAAAFRWKVRKLLTQGLASGVLLLAIMAIVEVTLVLLGTQEYMVPRPTRVLATFFGDLGYFWTNLRSTLTVMLVGTALSFCISLVLASLMAHSGTLTKGLFSLLVMLKLVPTIAVAPLIVIWFGFGSQTQIVVVVLATFFPMVVNLHLGLTSVDPAMILLLRSNGASRWQIYRKLRLPNAVPSIFLSLRTALPLSAIGAIVGEWVGASVGIGYIVKMDSSLFRTSYVFAALLAIAIAGVVLFSMVVATESYARRHERR